MLKLRVFIFIKIRRICDDSISLLARLTRFRFDKSFQKVPLYITTSLIDLFLSFFTKNKITIGRVSQDLLDSSSEQLMNHPKLRDFFIDNNKNKTHGVHLGVDIIINDDDAYIIEINKSAALRPERREIYKNEFDPIIEGIVKEAVEAGKKKIIPVAHFWGNYRDEWLSVGELYNVEIKPTSFPWSEPDNPNTMSEPPQDSDDDNDSLYIFFNLRDTPVEAFLNHKYVFSCWISEYLKRGDIDFGNIKIPKTKTIPFCPEKLSNRFPNLIVKAANADMAESIIALNVDNSHEVYDLLGIGKKFEFPKILYSKKVIKKIINKVILKNYDQAIYQQFIPPKVIDNKAEIIRAHYFISPKSCRLLSAHKVISGHEVPSSCESGLIKNLSSYIVNFSLTSGVKYGQLDKHENATYSANLIKVGKLIQLALIDKFIK